MYLVVKCEELNDQYECDARRTPICVIDNYANYNKIGYEIYRIHKDGSLEQIRDYEDVTDEYISYCEYQNRFDKTPVIVVRLKKGDRCDITKDDVKEWRNRFGFSKSIKDIKTDFQCSGKHGEIINTHWCVIGETLDDWYPN